MVDVLTAVVAGAAGLGLGAIATYFVFFPRSKGASDASVPRSVKERGTTVSVTTSDLERSRREMRTIMVERDLLSSAMMKLYEAENEGRITREEREAISKRYSEQIKDLQSKLKDVELVVEVGELEGLRNELVILFETRVQNIESRLDAAKQRLGVAAPEAVKKEVTPRVEKDVDLERAVERRAKPEMTESERRVKEIRDEVMEALTRLEQIDIEKKQQDA
jgi:proline dehydrogenase